MRYLFPFLLFTISSIVFGQHSVLESEPNDAWSRGMALFDQGQYLAAEQSFQNYLKTDPGGSNQPVLFYLAIIRMIYYDDPGSMDALGQGSGPEAMNASVLLGDYYFEKKSYPASIEYYQKIPASFIQNAAFSRIRYRLAYSLFAGKKYDEAEIIFKEVINFGEKDKHKASYYAGYIAFQKGSSEEALTYLLVAEEDPKMVNITAPLIAQMYLDQREYQALIDYSEDRLERVNRPEEVMLLAFQGEAYFALQQYEHASMSFQRSIDLDNKSRDPGIYYKLAFSYDQMDQFDKAINNYKVSALDDSSIGQLSAFRLGVLYSRRSSYSLAVSAFESAINDRLDKRISEQSHFLAGKALLKSNRFEEAIFMLRTFLENYKGSSWKSEAEDLVVQSYYQTSDYQSAIKFLEESGVNSTTSQEIYQMVTFSRGQQLFNESKPEQAITYLQKSLVYPVSNGLQASTRLILGDSYSLQGKHTEAIQHYQRVGKLTDDQNQRKAAKYGLAYAYYNTQQYQNALSAFQDVLPSIDAGSGQYKECNVRIADCYYLNKEYDLAISFYNQALRGEWDDFVNYQLGLVYYLNGNSDFARSYFQKFFAQYNQSEYADNALFQLGKLEFENLQFQESERIFTQLINDYPSSGLVPNAILQRALSNANVDQYGSSEDDFKYILQNYPRHATARDALLGLQDLIQRGHEVSGFDDILDQVKANDPDNTGLVAIEVDYGKSRYFSQAYDEAIQKFEEILVEYPDNPFKSEILYYLGDSYNQLDRLEDALQWFDRLYHDEQSPFIVRVLDKRGQILTELNRSGLAIENYRKLLSIGGNARTAYKAMEGLMINYFKNNRYDSVHYFGNEIVNASWKPINAVEIARLFRGKSYYAQKSNSQALDEFIEVMNTANGETAAEAYYFLATIQYEESSYAESRETLFRLIADFGSYKKWTDEAFLLISDNYLAEGEILQARATLNSIIERSEDQAFIRRAEEKMMEVNKIEEILIRKQQADSTSNNDTIR